MSSDQPEPRVGDLGQQAVDSGTEPTTRLGTGTGHETWPGDQHESATSSSPWEAPREEEAIDRRQLSVSHLVTGLVFLGVAGLWLAQELGAVAVDDLDLLVPLLLVVVGAAGLVASLARVLRDGR
jgi:hypothetical protein